MISIKLTTIHESVEDMYDAIEERNIPIPIRHMNQLPMLVSFIKNIPYPTVIPTDNLPSISDKTTAMLQIKSQIKSVIEDSGVEIGDDITTYGDCIRAIIAYDFFELQGPDSFIGRKLYITPYFNRNEVNAINWEIISGSQYATISQYGCIDILPDVFEEDITVRAYYCHQSLFTDDINITISYGNQMDLICPTEIRGVSGNCIAMYNKSVITPVWSIVSGNEYATINENGEITVLNTGNITITSTYMGYSASKQIRVIYLPNTISETTLDGFGNITTTSTTTSTSPETGVTIIHSVSTINAEDGNQTIVITDTIENTDGSSVSQSTTSYKDGTVSETNLTVSAPDTETGSVLVESNTVNYDDNGNRIGHIVKTSVINSNGESSSSVYRYDAEGVLCNGTNEEIDGEGNVFTQDIIYDENENSVVSGYYITTDDNPLGYKNFNVDGVNTNFYGFDSEHGFHMHIHFTINFNQQPPHQNDNHHQILTMKRSNPSPWYGFQIRHSSSNQYIQLGTQFSTGSNVNTHIDPPRFIETNVAEYDIEITYNPTLPDHIFVCKELISDTTILTSNLLFPDLPELNYLTVCIGYALDENAEIYRFSNINVLDFSISKLLAPVSTPVIHCNGQNVIITCSTPNASIYYRVNQYGNYMLYTDSVDIETDVIIETYSKLGNKTSETIRELCEYSPAHDYSLDYLTFDIVTDGTVVWQAFGTGYTRRIEYSKNNGEWTPIIASADISKSSIEVSEGDVIRFKGINATYAGSKSNYDGFEGGTADFIAKGNIMSLIYGDNFIDRNTMSSTYNFCSLFKKSHIISAENLILPAATLTQYCYRAMFSQCSTLVIPPALPALSLAQGCYWYMFEACRISTAPELLATVLVRECYGYMFVGCSLLNRIKCLATTGFDTYQCLNGWVNGVNSNGTFVKDESATSWPSGIHGIPNGWTVIDN